MPCLACVVLLVVERPVSPELAARQVLRLAPRSDWSPPTTAGADAIDELQHLRRCDPGSLGPILHAVRPATCAHAQCCDLATLVGLFDMRMTRGLRCPVCDAPFAMRDLVTCLSFERFLRDAERDVPRLGWHADGAEYAALYGPPEQARGYPVAALIGGGAGGAGASRRGAALSRCSAVALLCDGGDGGANSFILARVADPTPRAGAEAGEVVLLSGLRECGAVASLWLPTREEWEEPVGCVVPVEGVWLDLPALCDGEAFELHLSETRRLQELSCEAEAEAP